MAKIDELVAKATAAVEAEKTAKGLPMDWAQKRAKFEVENHLARLKGYKGAINPADLASLQVKCMVEAGISRETAQAIADEVMAGA